MDKDQETALVRNCQHGDKKAMSTLVMHLQKPVYNAAYRMLGNPDDAADVTQTTFLKVFENIRSFDPKFRLFSWTYRIALNESIDQLKRRKRTEPLQRSLESDTGLPQETLAASQLSGEVQSVLMELNEEQRAVMVLRYFSDCSYDDISRILELPGKKVKSRLFMARKQMKKRLHEHGFFSS